MRCSAPPATAYASSRIAIIISFGESGFSVFHAGHWDWQRPHSVQVVKSRTPFHEKSQIVPAPSTESSSRSSMSSRVICLPLEVSGFAAPSAVLPSSSRLNQMLNQTVNRCQAMPIVRFRATTSSQIIASTILKVAMP